jgi:hypothetical protein
MMANHPTSLNGPFMQVVSPSPQVDYVATCPMCSTDLNENEPLTV